MAEHDQQFDTFTQWVNKASSWLTRRDDDKAICYDSMGRSCRQGSDFARARDEGTFPVRWTWASEVGSMSLKQEDKVSSTDIYELAQWTAFNRVLSYINSLNEQFPPKAVIYNAVSDMRPQALILGSLLEATEVSGMSWSGFNIIGDRKSIDEVRRMENVSSQVEVYRAAFQERIDTLTAERDALLARIVAISDLISVQQNVSSPLQSALTFIVINNLCSLTTQPSKTETRDA